MKPGNLILLPDRRVKLIDLGLTHMLENPWSRVTRRINTKEYAEEIAHIAPEHAWGCEVGCPQRRLWARLDVLLPPDRRRCLSRASRPR